MQAHLFDLDHTLFNVNSSYSFGKYLYQNEILSTYTMWNLMQTYAWHKLGWYSIFEVHEKAFNGYFKGKSVDWVEEKVQAFLDQNMSRLLNSKVIQILQDAKQSGAFTAILSSSPDFLVRSIVKRLGVDDSLSSKYSVDSSGNLSALAELVDGPLKANYVQNLEVRLNISAAHIYAYSDSYLDIPFLEGVGHPICVNPDRKLLKLAKSKKWTIL